MRIVDVIVENPLKPAGTVARNVGVGVGAVAGAAGRAAQGYKSGYDAMKQALSGVGGGSKPAKADKTVNKKPVLAKIYHGELLDENDMDTLAKLKQGLEDGSIDTQLDRTALTQAIDTAISGKRVSPEESKLLLQFRREV